MFSQAFQAAAGTIWDRGEAAPNRPQPSDSSSSHRAIRHTISDNSIQNIPGSMEIKEIEYSDVEMDADVDELIQHLDAMTPSLSGIGTANEGTDDNEEHYSPRDDFFTATEGPLTGEGSSAATRIVESELVSLPQDIHLVCHSQIHQHHFDLYGIVWGVQWEIARLITAYPNFHWSHVGIDGLRDLCGTNASKAPSVAKRYLAESPELANYLKRERLIRLPDLVTPWDGYDAEEPYIRADHQSKSMNEQGGTILQRIHLQITKKTPSVGSFEGLGFRFTLEQPMKSKSSRFSRYLGSRRLIECHFSKQSGRDHQEKIIKFFSSKKLLINGRLFQAFYGHSLKIHLMEINEDFGRSPDETAGDHNRMSILDFIAWHNNTELNSNQTLGKWASRFSLGFSTSLPGLMFEPDHIYFIEDEYAPGVDPSSAAAHEIMTDGCGLINLAALRAVQETMGWESFPVHVQARIAGSKGLFSLHPHHLDPNEEPKIWMRKSQVKVKLSDRKLWSQFHYVLDVCSGPFMQTPSSITYEMILCLSAGGVPDQVFIDMLQQSIKDVATDLDPSLQPHGSELLWDSIYNSHRVLQSKLKNMLSPELQRAYGFVTYAEDDEVDPEETAPSKWEVGPDPASGTPASAQEQVLGWLQAGFKPTDPFVMERLVYLQKKLMESAVEKYRIIIPKSLRAHIIPDPLNVLEEGEVFFASSQTLLENSSGLKKHSILGPVIVSRNPCVQQSDARKVIAVDKYELWSRGYYDVVVFSTKGSCSLASILSGGDYDGDNVVLIWDEVIVNNFVNSDLSAARPTMEFEEENFEKSRIKLRDVVSRSQLERSDLQLQLIQALLQGAVVQNRTGRYNIFYRNSVYKNGLDHLETIRLGHMYAQCLDLAKSGLIIKEETWRNDVNEWDREPPACFAPNREEDGSHGQKRTIQRNQHLPFILDTLRHVAETETEAYKSRLSRQKDQIFGQRSIDDQLIHPFNDAKERVSQHGFVHELKLIQEHVETYREYYNGARSNQGEFSPAKRHGKRRKDGISIGEQQECERAVADAYNRNLPTGMVLFDDAAVRRVAASYAYYREAEKSSTRFNYSFGVAWAELCAIKARSTGGDFVTSTSGFMNGMAIHKKVTKILREMDL